MILCLSNCVSDFHVSVKTLSNKPINLWVGSLCVFTNIHGFISLSVDRILGTWVSAEVSQVCLIGFMFLGSASCLSSCDFTGHRWNYRTSVFEEDFTHRQFNEGTTVCVLCQLLSSNTCLTVVMSQFVLIQHKDLKLNFSWRLCWYRLFK